MYGNLTLEQQLNQARFNGGVVTFTFENGTKQVQALNKAVFTDDRKRNRSDDDVIAILNSIKHDLRATSFSL